MKYCSIEEIKAREQLAINNGIFEEILMERAGSGAAEYIKSNYALDKYQKIVIFCGKGNNGGDGFVLARYLAAVGYTVKVVLLSKAEEIKSKAALDNLAKIMPELDVLLMEKNMQEVRMLINKTDLLVDAIFGTGLNGQPQRQYADAICACNVSGKPIIAIDVPSGINGDTGPFSQVYIRAESTVTFIAFKLAMAKYPAFFGRKIKLIDLGI